MEKRKEKMEREALCVDDMIEESMSTTRAACESMRPTTLPHRESGPLRSTGE